MSDILENEIKKNGSPAQCDPREKSSVRDGMATHELSTELTSNDCPPDGGYGWACVAAVFFLNAHTWGISTCYSVFLAYYQTSSILEGATSLHYGFVGGLQYSQSFMIAPLASKVMGRFGIRTCLLVGAVLQTVSLIGASFASNIWHLYLGQGIGFAWGVGFILTGTQNVIPQWFTQRRSLANGLAAAGTGAGGLLYALVAGQMLQTLGVGWSIRILGIASGVVNILCGLVMKSNESYVQPAYNLFNFGLLKEPKFLALLGFAFLSMLAEIIILTQIPGYGTSVLGLNTSESSIIGAMVALGQITGRTIIGEASDKFGRLNVASLVTFLAGLWTVAVWTVASSYAVLIFFSLCIGAFAGAFWAIIGPVTAEVVGLRYLPDSLSMLFLLIVTPTLFSPVIANELVSFENGSYLGCQLFAGIMFIASAFFVWALRCLRLLELDRVGDGVDMDLSMPDKASFLEKAFLGALVTVNRKL